MTEDEDNVELGGRLCQLHWIQSPQQLSTGTIFTACGSLMPMGLEKHMALRNSRSGYIRLIDRFLTCQSGSNVTHWEARHDPCSRWRYLFSKYLTPSAAYRVTNTIKKKRTTVRINLCALD